MTSDILLKSLTTCKCAYIHHTLVLYMGEENRENAYERHPVNNYFCRKHEGVSGIECSNGNMRDKHNQSINKPKLEGFFFTWDTCFLFLPSPTDAGNWIFQLLGVTLRMGSGIPIDSLCVQPSRYFDFPLQKKKQEAQEVCLDFSLTKLDQNKAYCFKTMSLWQRDTRWWKPPRKAMNDISCSEDLTVKSTFCFPQWYFTVISISPSLTTDFVMSWESPWHLWSALLWGRWDDRSCSQL